MVIATSVRPRLGVVEGTARARDPDGSLDYFAAIEVTKALVPRSSKAGITANQGLFGPRLLGLALGVDVEANTECSDLGGVPV
jgi:hypothetical protein